MQCPICLQNPTCPVVMACCANTYCQACIDEWTQIRNVCPLCCAPTGLEKVNLLLKKVSSEAFDDGSLLLQPEIQAIKKSIAYNEKRIANRRQQFLNRKTTTSSSVMEFLETELLYIKDLENSMDEHYALQNRAATVESMQCIVQSILGLENALDNNFIRYAESGPEKEGYGEDEEEEESGDQYDQYEEYQFEVNINDKKVRDGRRKFKAGQEAKIKG